ncbi:MAG: hypothetical protein OEQ13_05475 [Acidobacteriota bacterium]|nr:hypothetical protein [Acidobacteriota bacterium]
MIPGATGTTFSDDDENDPGHARRARRRVRRCSERRSPGTALPGAPELERGFQSPIWTRSPDARPEYRLREPAAVDRALRLEYRWPGGEVYSMEDWECSGSRRVTGWV